MERKPLAIDLYAGLGGWTEGLLAEGFEVIGFDIERHAYGDHRYPSQLVLQDVRTIDGAQFKDAALIVASPPCQEYSYMAMPWTRAKKIAEEYRSGARDVAKLNELFDACFRIQREAIEASTCYECADWHITAYCDACEGTRTRFIPLVVENVRGAQPWVGRSRWSYGSFHLWGDVPALMPIVRKAVKVTTMGAGWYPPGHPKHVPGLGFNTHADRQTRAEVEGVKAGDRNKGRANGEHRWTVDFDEAVKIGGARGDDWFTHHNRAEFMARAGVETAHLETTPFGTAVVDDKSGRMLYNLLPEFYPDRATKNDGGSWFNVAHNTTSGKGRNPDGRMELPELCPNCCAAAIAKGLAKGGAICEGCSFAGVKGFTPHGQPLGKNELGRKHGSKSSARKAASARIAKIPLPLARHIARTYFPK